MSLSREEEVVILRRKRIILGNNASTRVCHLQVMSERSLRKALGSGAHD